MKRGSTDNDLVKLPVFFKNKHWKFSLSARSVVGVLGPSGDRVNRYSYDPFGRMLEFDEELPQDFTFIGQWGVTADRELRDIYWMRSRHYDAQLGRFLSFDPLGKSPFPKYYNP